MRISSVVLSGLLALCAATHAAAASPTYSKVIAFGDDATDTGNLFRAFRSPGAPYFQGRLSNGYLPVEVMSQQLGLSLTSYAFIGAQTGPGNALSPQLYGTGIQSQINTFGNSLQQTPADPNALYFVWAGGNDFATFEATLSPSAAVTAANNMEANITRLYQLGAREIFVPLMADLGLTPFARQNDAIQPGVVAAASARSAEFNALMGAKLQTLNETLAGVHIVSFDTLAFLRDGPAAPEGFNVTDACYIPSAGVCSNPDAYYFWDNVHPSAVANGYLGLAFAAAVPEPSTWMLSGIGLALLGWVQKRRTAAAASAT